MAGFPRVGPKVKQLLSSAGQVFKWGQFTGSHAAKWTKGRVALLGDSAHAMLATLGQGAAMAFEDSYVLADRLAARRGDYATGLAEYEAIRKPRATKIQEMSRTEVRFKQLRTPLQRVQRRP